MTAPHVAAYIQRLIAEGKPEPMLVDGLDRAMKSLKPYNLIYEVSEHLSIHIQSSENFTRYTPIEPPMDERTSKGLGDLMDGVFKRIPDAQVPKDKQEFRERLNGFIDAHLRKARGLGDLAGAVRYYAHRELLGSKRMDPIIADPWIEDINALGTTPIWVVHKIFGPCRSDIVFETTKELDEFLMQLAEGMGRPVSEARPIVDGALPDGSRINIIFGESVSKGGSSFTIRKFSDVPIPVTQLIAWGTFDTRVAAYLWLCMEHGMSIFVAGETASGKTTTLNALLPLVPANTKILTAEDTPEVNPPHTNWQQLVTRDGGAEGTSVDTGDLLKVGLRARPDRIIVGEIRGAEGAVAIQAMQTGYPTFATFHASSVGKLIQRFTSDPINVPPQFMPNLNVVLVQLAVHVGGRRLRRVMEVEEIEGYSREMKSPITRQVFKWDPNKDAHTFSGKNNSYVLENLVAPKMGLRDTRQVYKELDRRTAILDEMVRTAQFDYHDTLQAFRDMMADGMKPEELPVMA